MLFLDSVGLVRVGLLSMVQIRKLFFIYQFLILTDPTSFKGRGDAVFCNVDLLQVILYQHVCLSISHLGMTAKKHYSWEMFT